MKRLLITLILVLVCGGGFWYAYTQNFFMEDKIEPQPLVVINKDEVTRFVVKNNKVVEEYDEVPVMEFNKVDGKWAMTLPDSYVLNSYSSDSWVNAFTAVLAMEQIETGDMTLAEFGLDNPRFEFEVTLEDGAAHRILVGDQTPVFGFSYVKTGDADEVYRANDEELKALQKKPFDFLDKSAFQFEYNKLNSMYVEWLGEGWQITKDNPEMMGYQSTWKLGTLELTPDDGSSFIDRMINISTNKMIKPYSDIDFDEPELRVMLVEDRGENEPETSIYFGKVNPDNLDEIWVAKLGSKWAFALSTSQAESLFEKAYQIVEKLVIAEYEQEEAAKSAESESDAEVKTPQEGSSTP